MITFKRLLVFIPFVLFLLLVIVFIVQLNKNNKGETPTLLESVLIGKKVPKFELPDLFNEEKIYSETLFSGDVQSVNHQKPVLMNIWATWCPTCYEEHQFLYELSKKGIVIIGVNYKDNRDKAVKWLKELQNPYEITFFDRSGMFGLDLGVYGAPETFLIDKKGIIRYRNVGDVNPENWEKVLHPLYQKLLKED